MSAATGADTVVGFGHQLKALIPQPPEGPDSEAAQPGQRIIDPAAAPEFRGAKNKNGVRMDASDDAIAEHRRWVAAYHLGSCLSL
jgi:hypothetical protein